MNEGNKFRFDLWLYNEMKRKGWTMKELAEKAGVSASAIADYIHNIRMPTMATLSLILDALDAHMEFVRN